MKPALLFACALLFSSSCFACERPDTELTLAKTKAGRTLRWEFRDAATLLRAGTLSGASLRHAEWVKAHTALGAAEVFENHIRVGDKLATDLREGDPFLAQLRKSERNARRILRGEVGEIQPIRCLELLPFEEFLKAVDLRSFAGEMFASVLVKDGRAVLVGDFYKRDTEGGVVESPAALRERAKLLKQGWKLEHSLHNHPWVFNNPYGDLGGILGPSDPDVQGYRRERPAYGVITNGIESISMPRAGYLKLEP